MPNDAIPIEMLLDELTREECIEGVVDLLSGEPLAYLRSFHRSLAGRVGDRKSRTRREPALRVIPFPREAEVAGA